MIRYLLFKYLRFDRSMPFILITKLLAFLGVGLGVAVLIISMGVMNGMNKSFIDKLLTMNYPITMYSRFKNIDDELISELSKDYKISPFIQTQAAIKYKNELRGAVIFGVDYEKEKEINEIFKKSYQNTQDKFPAILGNSLADRLGVFKGDKINVIFTNLSPNAFSISPTIKSFKVLSSFHSGLSAYDSSYVYLKLDDVKKVLKTKALSGVHLHSDDPYKDAKILKNKYKNDYYILGWWEQNGNFFKRY